MPHRVLVVGHSPIQSAHLRSILADEGYTVELVEDGQHALEQMRLSLPDLIISEIIMPKLDGFALCEAVKSCDTTRKIPFVFLAASSRPLDVIIGLERGADNFITKPIVDAYLLEQVRSIFKHQDLERAGEPPSRTLIQAGNRKIAVNSAKHQIVELLVAMMDEAGRKNDRHVESRTVVQQHRSRIAWEERIRQALQEDRLRLFGQPILDLRSDRIAHYEVLVRMVEPDGALILPGVFLTVAEQSTLISEIDYWVIRRAFQLASQARLRDGVQQFAVKLSSRSLTDMDMVPAIYQALQETGADPAQITFEVTETAVVADIDQAISFLTELKGLGFWLALENFSAGYSAFDYLKHLPVDLVKMNGNFVRSLPLQALDQQLVKAMIDIVHVLDKRVVGEFVEDEVTLQLLRSLGFDFAQGYHLGRPRSME